jgi:hypothetical protein
MIARIKKDQIHNWAKTVSGVTTVWMNQRAPRPAIPYVAIDIIAGPVKVGHDNLRQDIPGQFYVAGMRSFTLSVNVFGNNANDLAERLVTSLEMPSVQELLRVSDIAIIDTSDVRVLDLLQETDVEGRAQFDFRFATSINRVDNGAGYIETVEVLNELDNSTVVVDDN